MQDYLQKTHLSTVMDEIGVHLALLAGSLAGFSLLWGLRGPAVAAGLAAYTLCALLRARTRERRLRRREDRLRQRIGGEIQLEAWTACPAEQAHFETARLLHEAAGFALEKVTPDGAICRLPDGGRVMVACAQLHRAEKLSAREVAAFQRACVQCGAARGYLCGAGGAAPEAAEQAGLSPPVRLISRAQMCVLAGAAAPATDQQLVALGRRYAGKRDLKALRRALLSDGRAEKYLLYALLLLGLYLIAGQGVYLVAGLTCLGLMTLCRLSHGKETRKPWE